MIFKIKKIFVCEISLRVIRYLSFLLKKNYTTTYITYYIRKSHD